MFNGASSIETIRVANTTTNVSITTLDQLVDANANFLTVDATSLTTGVLTFNGSAETDARFMVFGGAANDSITGSQFVDELIGGAGADFLSGGGSPDYFRYRTGDVAPGETIDGGSHTDTIIVETSTDFTNLSTATILTSGSVEQILILSGQIATFTGSQLTGQAIAVNANFPAAATLTITVASGTTANFSTMTFISFGGFDPFDTGVDVININGTTGNETITGTSLADNFASSTGTDNLSGGGGDDRFTFAAGTGLTNADTVSGGAGNDIILLTGNTAVAATNFNGASSIEWITVANTTTAVAITAVNALVDAGATLLFSATALTSGVLTFNGSAETDGAFNIYGGNANDTITGGSGANSLRGKGGADALSGGVGNDTFIYNTGDVAAGETINGGADTDTLLVETSTDFTNLSTATILTTGSVEQILITSGRTATFTGAQLTGQAIAVNATEAGWATLTINAANGGTTNLSAMTFAAFGANNAFDTGVDAIIIVDTAGSEVIVGTSLADNFLIGAGGDNLSGGGGNDIFHFAAGVTGLTSTDTVSGGAGTDSIVLTGNTAVVSTDFNGASSIEAITIANTTIGVSITPTNALVDAGATLTVNATSLTTGSLNFNGNPELDGNFNITGGGAETPLSVAPATTPCRAAAALIILPASLAWTS